MLFVYILIGLVVGGGAGYLIRQSLASRSVESAEGRAIRILEDAKNKEKEVLLEAKGKSLEIIEEAKKQESEFRKQIVKFEERIDRKEKELESKSNSLDKQKQDLEIKAEQIKQGHEEITALKAKQLGNLEKIAKMTREEASKVLLSNAEKSVKEEMLALYKKLVSQAYENADREARNILVQAIERVASEVTAETTTTTVQIPSEEMKGRIIGKEGRNIRAFEQMMGVEILIDDSPDTVVISGFNSIRRHIAKLTLEKLLADGRIHPARIEEAYEKSKAEINEQIKQAGEQAVYDLGITTFPPKLVHLIGRLYFRTSYGQNILRHSVEMAKIGALMAEEVGADVKIVKQGALLHDIGKALDQDLEGSHVELGKKVAEKFNLDGRVVEAIASHHHDTDVSGTSEAATSLEAVIVDACDNISGARPGARKDSLENYLKRLTDLENIANRYEGVEKTYAIQGGREIRVFVTPQKLDDLACQKLARDIANALEQEIKFPGEIKVHVIRETRVIEYAR
ncbi:MAG: ribonuclease Y [Candidatus Doudnabacteria bacterium CG10_big_fil_rev_8_21_14_0_10_42_18]|uniref:Ribonuclease Y n=1 Tax=Candidatus Doudnabacteria bacterium CG10_big_fil_rev_8_21_14_0_10_42_18 TaxID=1974552 RepID=A0A2H0VAI7_9BACT|nr:MAG: ribonuclease Y [Candidatus Doudnabacteria bacterium CG10_big_fil_rev_8_21_14_0_10_42_18]